MKMNDKPRFDEASPPAQRAAKNPLDPIVAAEDSATLDRVLRAAPSTLTEADLDAMIEALRRDRVRFTESEERRAAKRRGEETVDVPETE
jgi:hypothetical protein